MCVQKIGAAYTQNVKYNCNSVQVTIQGITHTLDKLLSYTNQSCVLSNDLNTFELYIPAIDLKKLEECFNCSQKVTLDGILSGVDKLIVNSFNNNNNTNSNNSNSTVGNTNSLNSCCTDYTSDCEKKEIQRKELEIKEQLDRIEKEVHQRNYAEFGFYPIIFVLCLILIGIILFLAKNLQ